MRDRCRAQIDAANAERDAARADLAACQASLASTTEALSDTLLDLEATKAALTTQIAATDSYRIQVANLLDEAVLSMNERDELRQQYADISYALSLAEETIEMLTQENARLRAARNLQARVSL